MTPENDNSDSTTWFLATHFFKNIRMSDTFVDLISLIAYFNVREHEDSAADTETKFLDCMKPFLCMAVTQARSDFARDVVARGLEVFNR